MNTTANRQAEDALTGQSVWGRLARAAQSVDVSTDTILRRAVEFPAKASQIDLHPVPKGRIRFKKLKLGDDARQERRYYLPDLVHWLV